MSCGAALSKTSDVSGLSDISGESTSRYSKVNWVTCIVLLWFHVQAIAALGARSGAVPVQHDGA